MTIVDGWITWFIGACFFGGRLRPKPKHGGTVWDLIAFHWGGGVQVDVVAINWREQNLLLGESKWQAEPGGSLLVCAPLLEPDRTGAAHPGADIMLTFVEIAGSL